ncbi:hypothetical protein AB1Y20_020912 [Prymnesium parvum]|uniref:Methyltransferase FkbM domain-containing protein n=1 Tax=Prymnesium parvum TaxID=97485 RepID=A0AB34JI30_PRYPA
MAVLFVALGTRGDVEPLLRLARALARRGVAVTFITHRAHRRLSFDCIRLVCTHTDPLRPPAPSAAAEEYAAAARCCAAAPPQLLVFNLFSLGAWHVAQRFALPSLALSPCLVPYEPPLSFASAFAERHPALYARLQEPQAGQVGWADVMHWMWPLWSERWDGLQEQLGLDGVPCAAPCATTPLLYAISPALLPRPSYWPEAARVLGFIFDDSPPDAPPAGVADGALYVGFGSSSELLLRPPRAAGGALALAVLSSALHAAEQEGCPLLLHCCGCRRAPLGFAVARPCRSPHAPLLSRTPPERWPPHSAPPHPINARAPTASDPLTASDFSSTAHALTCRSQLRDCWREALSLSPAERASVRVVRQGVHIAFAEDFLAHEHVFPRCTAVFHHGGAGTCAAALLAGTPQLILPLIFDQCANAERLQYHDVAAALKPSLLSGEYLLDKLREVTLPAAREACAAWKQRVRQEEGLPRVLEFVLARLAEGGGETAAAGEGRAAGRWGGAALLDAAVRWKRRRERESEDAPVVLRLPDGQSVRCASLAEGTWISDEVYGQACYLPAGSGVQLPSRPHATLVDAGANVGIFSLWAAARCPLARVIAIEPAPRTFELLRSNVQAAGMESRVLLHNAALGASAGVSQLSFYPRMPGNSTLHPAAKWEERVAFRSERWAEMYEEEQVECKVLTLSDLLHQHGVVEVALLKIDVEHHELAVLEGVAEDTWRHILQVVVETHTELLCEQVLSLLRQHYSVVGQCPDLSLAQSGLHHAIMWARSPREEQHTQPE